MMELSLLSILLTFPAIIFTVLLAVVLLYWLLIILGSLDIDSHGDISKDGFFEFAGLTEIPVSIVLSFLIIFAWLFSMLGTYYLVLAFNQGVVQWIVGFGVLFASVLIAIFCTFFLTKPLRPFFESQEVRGQENLIGKVCYLTTSRVDEKFGQAAYHDGGAGLILSIRAQPNNHLSKGSKVLIIAYDAEQHVYQVVPYPDDSL